MTMPKPVCMADRIEMHIYQTDVVVVEHAVFGPYQLYGADEFVCPECGLHAVANFGTRPMAEHHEPKFRPIYLNAHRNGLIRHAFEDAAERRRWEGGGELEWLAAVGVPQTGGAPQTS